jgi:hypothetical protein
MAVVRDRGGPAHRLQIALAAMTASLGLDPDRSVRYVDLVYASLSEAARKSLQAMDPAKYEFQSEFALRYQSQGHAEGEAKGRAEGEARVLIKLLTLKFGALSDAVKDRVQTARVEELELWTERVLSALDSRRRPALNRQHSVT